MREVVQATYNRVVRPHLPRKIAVYNGVPVRNVRLFDVTDVVPDYEAPLVGAIRQRVQNGDTVVIVGGGLGVSTVAAARQCGPDGTVVAYEAGGERAERARETIELNGVADVATVRRALVETDVAVVGDAADVPTVAASDLPDCDVLVLDCEGAELDVLEASFDAHTLIVEAHGFLDSPESAVRDRLVEEGHQVVDRGVELAEKGVVVLTAVPADERFDDG